MVKVNIRINDGDAEFLKNFYSDVNQAKMFQTFCYDVKKLLKTDLKIDFFREMFNINNIRKNPFKSLFVVYEEDKKFINDLGVSNTINSSIFIILHILRYYLKEHCFDELYSIDDFYSRVQHFIETVDGYPHFFVFSQSNSKINHYSFDNKTYIITIPRNVVKDYDEVKIVFGDNKVNKQPSQ